MTQTTRRTFLAGGAAAVIARPAFPAARARVTDLRTISLQPEYYHGWPTLAQSAKGGLLLVYSGGRESHVCPFGRVDLMRSHDTTFDFDLDLAEKQSDENPVFYVQYAHARICSVIEKAEGLVGKGEGVRSKEQRGSLTPHPLPLTDFTLLTHEKELALIRKICDLPFEVQRCAADYGVHRLTTFAIELARTYHHFYDACRVIQPDQPELSQARLALCEATRIALKATLDLLGVSAPPRMDRNEPL